MPRIVHLEAIFWFSYFHIIVFLNFISDFRWHCLILAKKIRIHDYGLWRHFHDRGIITNNEEGLSEMIKRDKEDISRKNSPLIIPDGSLILVNEKQSIEDLVKIIKSE